MKYQNGECRHSHIMRVCRDIIGSSPRPRSSKAFHNFAKYCHSRLTSKAGRFTANGWRNKSGGTTTIHSEIWDVFVTNFSARSDWSSIRESMQNAGLANKRSLTCARKPAWARKKLNLKSNVTSSRLVRRAPTK